MADLEGVPVIYKDSAERMITPPVREVLDRLVPLVGRHARDRHVPLKKIEVGGIPASDEAWEQLIVAAQVELPLDSAYAYWGELSEAVEEWTRTLPTTQADILLDLIGLEVREDENSAAV